MEPVATLYSAIIGCGPSGCFLLSLLRQSHAKAKLIAVSSEEDSLNMSAADQKILVKPGEKPAIDIGAFELAFVILDPSEDLSLQYAQMVASRVSAEGGYVLGVAINKPGNSLNEAEISKPFGSLAIVDASWVLEKRGDSDDERALQIAFNFTAHTLTFLADAIDSGDLKISHLKEVTSGGVCGFAASHVSEAEAIYAMTMSHLKINRVKAGIVFVEADTDDVLARRIFLKIAATLPRESNLSMLRLPGLAPFKVMAMLVH
jgi:threonine dehydrogenase-like Zn-dependent dehydrogenase